MAWETRKVRREMNQVGSPLFTYFFHCLLTLKTCQDVHRTRKRRTCKAVNPQTRRAALPSPLPSRMLPEPNHCRLTLAASPSCQRSPIFKPRTGICHPKPTRPFACMPYTSLNVPSRGQTHRCGPSGELENLGLDTSPGALPPSTA